MNGNIFASYTMKRHLHKGFWLIASLIALSCMTAYPVIAGDQQEGNTTQLAEFIVSGGPALQWQPKVANSIIVWHDERNADGDIYGYNLNTQSEFAICTTSGDQSVPDVYGDIVVWQDRRNSVAPPDIYGYNLATHTEFPICVESHGQGNPVIYGNYVVWQDSRAGSYNQDIYAYNLNTHTEFPISTAGESQVAPDIYGNIIVWMDYRNEPNHNCWPNCNTDIYGYDLTSGTEFAISTEEHYQGGPRIYGNTVVWIDKRYGNYDVFGYNLTTHQEFAVCTEGHDQIGVSIDKNWIAWTDGRNEPNATGCGENCNYDLYAYSRATGVEIPLITESHRQFQQDVDGDLLIWTDKRSGNDDIYGAAILPGEAGPASGRTQNIGPDENVVVKFALPMNTSSVTYKCSPDPGGWTANWGTGVANSTILTLSHAPFTLSTTYGFTVTGGENVFGQSIAPFGVSFTTYTARIYLPIVMKNR